MAFDKWPIILLAIDAPFFIFSISMIVFIVVQIRRNNPEFNGGFYKLFIVMAVNDTLLYIESLFMSRIPIAGGMSEFYLGNSTLIQVWDNFGYALNGFMTSFNLLGHTAIAFNRFSTLFLSQRYQWMWSGRRLTSVVILLFVLSLVSVCYRIYGPFHYILTVDGVVALYNDPVIRQIYPIERTAIFVSTSILTLVLEASTGIKYRLIWHKLNPYNKVLYNKDMQLFRKRIF